MRVKRENGATVRKAIVQQARDAVAYLLKTKTVKRAETDFARERLCKHTHC
jgi:hypothetical protein